MTTKQSKPRAARANPALPQKPPTLEELKLETEEQQQARIQAIHELLDSWTNVSEEEAEDQRETMRILREALPRHFPKDE